MSFRVGRRRLYLDRPGYIERPCSPVGDVAHRETRADARDAGDPGYACNQIFEVGDVGHNGTQQIILISDLEIAVHDFGDAADFSSKAVADTLHVFFQRHLDECHDAQADNLPTVFKFDQQFLDWCV